MPLGLDSQMLLSGELCTRALKEEAEVRVGGGAEDGKHYIKAKRTNVSC